MKRLGTIFGSALALVLICLGQTPARSDDITFDINNYKQMADADSSATIPPGTKITLANWQQYKQFMTVGMQAAFSGKYSFHVTADPMYTVVVGTTTNVGAPSKFLADGEKYGSQVKLVPAKTGGYTIEGWVAGPPFPNPSRPDTGLKVLYDTWAPFRPALYHCDVRHKFRRSVWQPLGRRDTYVIDAKWIPSLGSYCFSHRIFYLDRQAYFTMTSEEYDNENKLWKAAWLRVSPMPVHGQPIIFIYGTPQTQLLDWQNGHATIGLTHEMKLYQDVPPQYHDVPSLSQPGSLDRIMQ
jgi:Protein of unknown function (DUF1329)